MRNKAILFSLILVASSSVLAEQGLLEGVAKQAAKDKATVVAPNAVEKVEAANQTLDKAKTLKEGAEIAPDALQDQTQEKVKESVKEKATEVAPKEAEKTVETLKTGKETAENLKGKVESTPKSTKAIKSKAKQKAAEKALNLVH